MSPPTCPLRLRLEVGLSSVEILLTRLLPDDGGAGVRKKPTRRLVEFDTSAGDLRRRGITLRVQPAGRSSVQSISLVPLYCARGHDVFGFETSIRRPRPDIDAFSDKRVRNLLRKLVGKSRLIPVREVDVERTRMSIGREECGMVDVSLDRVETHGSTEQGGAGQLVLESRSGNPLDLARIASTMLADTKFEIRDFGPFDSAGVTIVIPRLSSARTPTRRTACAVALRHMADRVVLHILRSWELVQRQDGVEGPHQLRVGLRRLRSFLKAMKALANGDVANQLGSDARELSQLIGELRDVDVLRYEIVPDASTHPGYSNDIAEIIEALDALRAERLASLRKALMGKRWVEFQMTLALLPQRIECLISQEHEQHLRKPIGKLSDRALSRQWRKVMRGGKGLAQLDIDQRHELRK